MRLLPVPVLAVVALTLAGCSTGFLSGEKVDYQSGARQTNGLEVPPDLTQLAREGRYQAPAPVVSAAATASTPVRAAVAAAASVAPAAIGDMRVMRDGDLRWLVVPMTPEQLWPQLRQFWLDSGFTLEVDDPAAGVLETGWAENRANLPKDAVRRALGAVLDSLYDSGLRDRYRTRIERTANGTEVFISHRGAEQIVRGAQKDDIRWAMRPSDPQLEAEFLSRLMVRLGTAAEQAQAAVAAAQPSAPSRARLMQGAATPSLEVDETFDRAWRRVGLALDRSGFTVEDRNRSEGVYFVRYVDSQAPDERGFFSRLFGGEEARQAQRFRIALLGGTAGTEGKTVVAVQTAEGAPLAAPVGERIAGVLLRELR